MELSILVPLFNGAATIERTAASLTIIRKRARVEIIVVDDGSSDDGLSLARRALESLGFGTVMLLTQANAGSAAARNKALTRARGEWVVFLDADDELAADPLVLTEAATPDTTAVIAAAIVVRDGRTVLRYRPPALAGARARRVLSSRNPFPISAVIARRSCIQRPFDESLRYLEDWDFWLHNGALFTHPRAEPRVVLTRIHAHGDNKSSQFAAIGRCRERVAQACLDDGEARLGRLERNNWRLQREIGRVLQGTRPRWSTAFALPCNPLLYAKFLAHACASRRVLARDPYAPV